MKTKTNRLEDENESLKKKIEDQKYTIYDLRKTVLDFQERYSGALKRIDELEKENKTLKRSQEKEYLNR